jgi:hypothetical protein
MSVGTPVAVPHIDFGKPTGNPLVQARIGFGLRSLGSMLPAGVITVEERDQ